MVRHTCELSTDTLAAFRRLLDTAFAGGFSDDDWEHTLGGLHAAVWVADAPVAHGAVVQRRLLHAGRALRTGYVEGVAVHPDHRGRGHAQAVMAELERVIAGGYELGALSASAAGRGVYVSRGWREWGGPTGVLTTAGVRRTPEDDGSVFVWPVSAPLDPAAELVCDWRDGDVW